MCISKEAYKNIQELRINHKKIRAIFLSPIQPHLSFTIFPSISNSDRIYDCFSHGFHTHSVIKHLKAKNLWSKLCQFQGPGHEEVWEPLG